MNALIVDTSSWISYFAGDGHDEIDRALEDGRIYIPSIVIAELLSGEMTTSDRQKMITLLKELPLCDAGIDHWINVGALRSLLAKKGFKISTPDAHIAQSSLDLNCFLLTEDKIFSKIAKEVGLRLI